ncbi:MAG TPA: rhamnulokinase family protein [Anaerolineales bacterium]|nr:rhamnulokinase family protein [Anaerolineales bacterium]
MQKTQSFLSIDLGAESGRAILGALDERLTLNEVHRFTNGPVSLPDGLHWDVLRLWSEIKNGVGLAASQSHGQLSAIGIDTWGVDFGLLDVSDRLIGNPYHYRDARTNGMIEAACRILPREEIYNQTGIQFMQLNTLFQLFAMRQEKDSALQSANTFLTMPDLFNFWLTGRKVNEFTVATTTQCYNPRQKRWASELLTALQIPEPIFQQIVPPGTVLEHLRASVARDASCERIPVIAVGCHDTASAVAAVPAEGKDFIYISSGTWSLIGIESDEPIINANSLKHNLTNEGGVCNTFRFLRNIMGMWLLQECRREWAKAGKSYSYESLTNLAAEATALKSFIFVGDDRFLAPGDMVQRIQMFCQETQQPVPQTDAEVVRCILESLALEYRWGTEKLRELSGKTLPVIHIIGGGSRNRLLNQFTADATGCQVIAGPVEATAIGNILLQAIALGHLSSLTEGRALVLRSFDVTAYEPRNPSPWGEAYTRYLALRK